MSEDRAKELHAELQQEVAALVSGEDWVRALDVASRFHRYSFGNGVLIRSQRPEATRVAGFNAWKAFRRHVRKGEKGIAILAPLTYRRAVSDPPATMRADSSVEEGEDAAREVRVLRGFRVVHVFDVAQTDGEPLPEAPLPEILAGGAPEGLVESLSGQIISAGFAFRIAPPAEVEQIAGRANGVTDWLHRSVLVRSDLPPAQRAKTTAHELAHVLLHGPGKVAVFACRDRLEVEAESVAYVVLRAVGLDPGAYSFPYVAHWANGDARLIAATGERVVGCARQILDRSGIDGREAA